jgi:iron complex outermembrane receptor protein
MNLPAAFAGSVALLALGVIGQTSAFAQTASEPQQLERITVTGSYLSDAAEVKASPLVTLDRAAIEQSGATDVLRLLKTLTPAFSGSGNIGNEVNLQGTGESYVALRNLPTLVLLNGRRLANSPFSSNSSSSTLPTVDLNTIPMAMIERIEVLKDSASTIYGSDAVGGVVNVILRKDYNGLEIGGRYGTDRHSDYTTKEGWAIGGVARPGWSLTVGGQYFENEKLLSTQRKVAVLSPSELVALGQNPAVLAAHISSSFAGRNGNYIIAGSPLAQGAPGYNPAIKSLPAKSSPSAAPQTMDQLVAAGYYIPISSTPASRAVGGTPSILNTALYGFAIVLPTERRQAFASGHKEIFGKRLEVFGDYLFSRTINGGSDLAPSPVAQVAPLTIPASNPYNLFGVTIGAGGAPNAPGLRTRLEEFGRRYSDNQVDMHRVVFGFRGEISDRWTWETAYNYTTADGKQTFFGGANGLAMQQTLIPLLNSSGGYVYDAQGRPLSIYTANGRNVPVFDFFGISGMNAPETIDALRTTLHREAKINQRSVDLRTTGKLFELPAGDVSMAIGGEWRREETSSAADSLFNAGLAVGYLPLNNLPKGERRTRAAFVETKIPVTSPKNALPFASAVDLTAALRYEHITPGGNASTPKFGLRWQPFDSQLVVRATYAKGFVAPSIFALFGPAQGAVPTLALPEGNGQTGAGGATGRIVSGQYIAAVSELSNPSLTAAKSESYTAGIVYSPKQIKGLNFSADYYHIEQDKVGGLDYTFIVGDLNARGAGSVYAPNFRFVDGTQLTANTPNQVTSTNAGSLRVVYNPLGDVWTDGVDLATNYRFPSRLGAFDVGADANVLFNFKARANPTSPYLQYARAFTEGINGKGNPQGVQPGYVVRSHVVHTFHRLTTAVRFNYVPTVNAPGTAFGAPAGTPNVLRADLKPYRIRSYRTVDLALTYAMPDFGQKWARKIAVTIGANNVFDEDAPFVPGAGSGVGSESNTVKSSYDIIGRFFFAELRKEF